VDTDLPTAEDIASMTVKQMQSVVNRLGVRARNFYGPKAELADELREFLRRRAADEPVGNGDNSFFRMRALMDEHTSAVVSEARPEILGEALALLAPLLQAEDSADFRRGVESCISVLIEAQAAAFVGEPTRR
jgi:hypothetical protein